jgi:phosphopentomutase
MARCIVIVLDWGGIDALPDAGAYGAAQHVDRLDGAAARVGCVPLAKLERLGLCCGGEIRGVASTYEAAHAARVTETTRGKNTEVPFPTCLHVFPPEVFNTGASIFRRAPSSGISASAFVFQVAAHEEVVPLQTRYEWCERATTAKPCRFAVDTLVNVLDRLEPLGIGAYAISVPVNASDKKEEAMERAQESSGR